MLSSAAIVAAGRLEPPTLQVELVGQKDDYVTVLVLSGSITDSSAILFVEALGKFEIVSREPWPDVGRILVLRAWPTGDP